MTTRRPVGAWRARVQVDGRRVAESFDTEREARDWEIATRAKAITHGLPSRITVAEYAARWLESYAMAAMNTRTFHSVNLEHRIVPHLGGRAAAAVTPTDITTLLNLITDRVSAARADRVYRTLSALFRSAEADDDVMRVPTRARRHRSAPRSRSERGSARSRA